MRRRPDALADYRAIKIAELQHTRKRSNRRAELIGILRDVTTDLLREELRARRRAPRVEASPAPDLLMTAG